MTNKNKENLLNIYDNEYKDELFSVDEKKSEWEEIIDIESKKIWDSEDELNINEEELWFTNEINELKKKEEWKKGWFFSNIFKKKKQILDVSIDDEKVENNETNIFDEFNQDESLLDEVDQIKKEKSRDMYFYLNKIWNYLKVIFVIFLVFLAIIYLYINIQNTVYIDDKVDNQLLWPFCFVLLNNVSNNLTFCTSISTLNNEYSGKLNDLKKKQVKDILWTLERLYKIENFTKTKDIIFLKDKTHNKLDVINILEKFDDLKNNFDKIDKQKIECSWISIDNDTHLLTMNCSAYSIWYENKIRWLDWKKDVNSLLSWTSISIANSFLNYISLESKYFTLIDKQKLFKSTNVIWLKTGFTNKTDFKLKLKYNLD